MTKLIGVTLADVARAAGLSTGGASYALRGHPSIPAATVARVRQIAAKMDYRPDLRVSSLMATIRRSRPLAQRETLAFVWVNTPRKTAKDRRVAGPPAALRKGGCQGCAPAR
jgi:LacI family transcriptional regulator